ncbi:MAG: DEAD/DEAH box helicase [Microbacteriaceae bacterium]|nr:DEAD/DEAH box helicase [Microbacteriaceae bacterium]
MRFAGSSGIVAGSALDTAASPHVRRTGRFGCNVCGPRPGRSVMPQNKRVPRARTTASERGTSARTTSARAASAQGVKPGSKSPKHRGYRPDETAATPRAKKPRWSADERSAQGRTADRRAGKQRTDRTDRATRSDRTERPADGRPNWEPRGKDARATRGTPRNGGRDARDRTSREPRGAKREPYRAHAERPTRQLRERAEHYVERPPRRPAPARDQAHHEARAPREDVVLERLEATAVTAEEVDGLGFADLGLGQNIVRELAELGAEEPFPIQAATIPEVLAGRDVLGRGRTGSGKTIAFGAPLVERLLRMQADAAPGQRREFGRAPRALILAPTRELALQIDRTVQPIARSVGLFTTQVYGGVPYARQLGALQRGVDIVIGTPGRVQDLAQQGRLDLSKVVITVLDEADHMCELGFAEPVQEILDLTAPGGQRLLFSATLDRGVAEIVEKYLVEPSVHEVAGEDQASSSIEHRVLLLDQRDKQQVLIELASRDDKTLVFARTRAFAEQLADLLDDAGIRAESIHGDLTQSRRQRALDKFANGRVRVLVATDVAARGIHVDDISLVIQADAPDEYKAYLHRSGRTGRAGRSGTVVTLVPRNRRRRTEELLQRAEIVAEWTPVRPGDEIIAELAAG